MLTGHAVLCLISSYFIHPPAEHMIPHIFEIELRIGVAEGKKRCRRNNESIKNEIEQKNRHKILGS